MMGLVLIGGVGLVLAFAAARQHQVDAAADLVAVSAATSLQQGGEACSVAARVASANGVGVGMCRIVGGDVIVEVRTRVRLPFGLRPWISARARAGPS